MLYSLALVSMIYQKLKQEAVAKLSSNMDYMNCLRFSEVVDCSAVGGNTVKKGLWQD